jgi:type IV pilus assembly protein PilE
MTIARGFTLIELLIALVIVAILSAVAWPGYGAIVQRAQRNDARLALLGIQQLQEMHYATHLRYAGQLGDAPGAGTLATPARSQQGHYQLSLTVTGNGQGYLATARASPDGRQHRDHDCQQLTIDQIGRQSSANAAGNWTESDPHRCWG